MSNSNPVTKDVTAMLRETWTSGPMVKKAQAEGPQFNHLWHDNCTVESATVTGNHVAMKWRFPVQYEYCNPAALLHGAAQALFYDICMAYLPLPLRRPGFWEELGFSRNLSLNFLRTVKIGEFVILEAQITQIGRNMCYLQATMKRESDGALISTCEQNKFNSGGGNMMAKL